MALACSERRAPEPGFTLQPPSVGAPSKIGMAPVPPVPDMCRAQRMPSAAWESFLLSTLLTEYITTKKAKSRVMKSA